ncbi:hypothetical protein CASFOL_001513 [Castilleja foliolosa]|uniref:Uncharacterized protein n=1 Tax=Castilleja foliolosa TaxID=1961234 RepID=A0ABD3EJE0_9LAMI
MKQLYLPLEARPVWWSLCGGFSCSGECGGWSVDCNSPEI